MKNKTALAALILSLATLLSMATACGALINPLCATQPVIDDCSIYGDNYADTGSGTCESEDGCIEHTTCSQTVLQCTAVCNDDERILFDVNANCGAACRDVVVDGQTFRCDVQDDSASNDEV